MKRHALILLGGLLCAVGAAQASYESDRARIEDDYRSDVAVCRELRSSEKPDCLREADSKHRQATDNLNQRYRDSSRDTARDRHHYVGDLRTVKPLIERDYQDDMADCRGIRFAGERRACERRALDVKKAALKKAIRGDYVDRTPPPPPRGYRDDRSYNDRQPAQPARCQTCGTVVDVREVAKPGEGSLLGVLGGAAVGGVLGNQVGKGDGRKAATVVGVIGGALAGREIEKQYSASRYYEVTFRLNNGTERTMAFDSPNHGFRNGDKIRFENNQLYHD